MRSLDAQPRSILFPAVAPAGQELLRFFAVGESRLMIDAVQ
ncbi:MAG: hypothetical protein JWN24_1534 [Phycisphaerales bacterium]|nr:hypothetical protein [Phycisphaerales bacterium]